MPRNYIFHLLTVIISNVLSSLVALVHTVRTLVGLTLYY